MSTVQVPYGVSQVTLSTSGVQTPNASRQITCTPQEATILAAVQDYDPNGTGGLVSTDPVTGAVTAQLPNVITQITINGQSYSVNGSGFMVGINAADFAAFVSSSRYSDGAFVLVQG
jgi:hypothetical protein